MIVYYQAHNIVMFLFLMLLYQVFNWKDHPIKVLIGFIIFILYFIRTPDIRSKVKHLGSGAVTLNNNVIKPCSGKVVRITENNNFIRIEWFLSVFDIHAQYCPVSGIVRSVKTFYGRNDQSNQDDLLEKTNADLYKRLRIVTKIDSLQQAPIYLEQIGGAITQSISNKLASKIGGRVEIGEYLGFIMLGSTCVLHLPKSHYKRSDLQIKVGDKKRVGSVIIG